MPAPRAKVSFTTFLYVSPVQTSPPCDHTGIPAIAFDGFLHFRSSIIPGSAWIGSPLAVPFVRGPNVTWAIRPSRTRVRVLTRRLVEWNTTAADPSRTITRRARSGID